MNVDLNDIRELRVRSMGGDKYIVSLEALGSDGDVFDKKEMIKLAENLNEALSVVLSSIS